MYIIDTNVLSELMKPVPNDNVVQWISSKPISSLFVTAITEAEILFGLALLPESRRKRLLTNSASEMFAQDFNSRILPFDSEAAVAYAKIVSERTSSGQPISAFDAQIAAVTLSRNATLVTRNTKDFVNCSVEVINPWK